MKPLLKIFPIIAAIVCDQGLAQEIKTPPATTKAANQVTIFDASKQIPPQPVVLPQFEVLRTQQRRVYINEGPPMTGLPAVEGEISIEVHEVVDPGLPALPEPSAEVRDVPQPPVEQPYLFGELLDSVANKQMVFISATVYDRSRTLLKCYLSGDSDKKITAWSNLDFNYYSGMGTFAVTGAEGKTRHYDYFMGIGNLDREYVREYRKRHGLDPLPDDLPQIPELPDDGPAYVVQQGDPDDPAPDSAILTMLDDLHAFYRDEGERLIESYEARKRAREARRAELLANPPKPKDVKVHFWSGTRTNSNAGGSQ